MVYIDRIVTTTDPPHCTHHLSLAVVHLFPCLAAANFNEFCRLDMQCRHTDGNTRCNPDLNMCQCLPRYKPQKQQGSRQRRCLGE